MHKNSRYNILQAAGNCNPNFVVIDGQRTDSGHADNEAKIVSGEMSRDDALILADKMQEESELVALEETPEQTAARDAETCKQELYKRKIKARKLSQAHNNTVINEVEKENKMEFTKEQLKAIKALQAAEKSPAWNRVSAYVIIAPLKAGANYSKVGSGLTFVQPIQYGKIKVIHPADGMGPLKVFVWDCSGSDFQMGHASGCGYDKMSAAMDGLKFDDLVFTDHGSVTGNWEMQLREAGYTVVQAI